ncbi:putative quinol monooxygenase [Flavobacterium algicola]|uniref:putative quinol monooxygenase n=1 Tax=Flavobacterium algicola TaxID=556529 RepID=UPI001EFDCB04|nr:putative quinol monooxygenase [Flavobacterium algicola]MCG9791881.1 antibiotic biosynthesis monooxygenase [Flavobacterium algicola]
MSQITVVAKIVAKEEKRDFVKAELLQLVQASVLEEGCITYNLHQDNDDANVFLVYENWKSAEALDLHSASEHFVAFVKATDGAFDTFVINKMTAI